MCPEAVKYGLNPQCLMDLSCLLCVKRFFESAVALSSPGEQWLFFSVHTFVHPGFFRISACVGTVWLSLLRLNDSAFYPGCML